VLAESADADVVVMAAAVADFRPASVAAAKLKKGSARRARRGAPWCATPTSSPSWSPSAPPGSWSSASPPRRGDDDADVLAHARAKLARKGCDLLVVNDVSGGRVFGRAENAAVVLAADGAVTELPEGSKDAVAAGIWDVVGARLA
jgi:phosphopantothenoylcysteine decarboxylase/phosphopantothenate--cysteine ligase